MNDSLNGMAQSPAKSRLAQRIATLSRLGVLILACAALFAACRGDGVTSPGGADCAGAGDCRPVETITVSPEVLNAIDDALVRIIPSLESGPLRGSLASSLSNLLDRLQHHDGRGSRLALARSYDALATSTSTADEPDLAAIRLALVPVARALGVAAVTASVGASQ